MKKQDVNKALLLSDDGIEEHAYLISRGVRPLALFNPFPAKPLLMKQVATRLENLSLFLHGAIPFVVDQGDGEAIAGYAADKGLVETFVWVTNHAPEPHVDRLVGLLLGYSVPAVAAYEQNQSIEQFDQSSILSDESLGPSSKSPCGEHSDTEEMFPLC